MTTNKGMEIWSEIIKLQLSKYNMKKVMLWLLGATLIAGCANTKNNESAVVENGVKMNGDTLILSSDSPLKNKIETETIELQDYNLVLSSTGVVTAIPSAYAEVAAPFGGRVVKSRVHIGQKVKAGSPLFEISSSDYSELVKNYIQTKGDMELASKALDRVRDLQKNRVASEKDLDEAQQNYTLALQEYRHAMAVAKEYQIDLDNATVGQAMVVRSPISGTVLRNELVMGEYIKEDAEAKVVVADLSKVWVKASVSEMESPYVAGVEDVEVRLASRPDMVFKGKVAYTDGMLNAETRTMQTYIECDNSTGLMMPNMYANVNMSLKGQKHIMLDKSAVLQSSKGRYVLRRIAENTFVKTVIEVQSVEGGLLLVTNGLSEGDEIISQGTFYFIDCK